ncbi:hypothetical protein [Methylomonas fluvii]|nr:hypothetical protein [Methylomonas fluvii]
MLERSLSLKDRPLALVSESDVAPCLHRATGKERYDLL